MQRHCEWKCYFYPDSYVLINKLNIRDERELADNEAKLTPQRLGELREKSNLVKSTFDLNHLKDIHKHIFQDIYEWVGGIRTVGMHKLRAYRSAAFPLGSFFRQYDLIELTAE